MDSSALCSRGNSLVRIFPELSHDDIGSICAFLDPQELLNLQRTCKGAYEAMWLFWPLFVKRAVPWCGQIACEIRFACPRGAMTFSLLMDEFERSGRKKTNILTAFSATACASSVDREIESAANTLTESACRTTINGKHYRYFQINRLELIA